MQSSRGFTLIELLVVVSMIAIIMGAISVSYSAAQQRARVQKATSDVKVISQAILAYENYHQSGGNYKLEVYNSPVPADQSHLSFLLGKESSSNGQQIPALLMAQLQNGSAMLDPWGRPYQFTIKQGTMMSDSMFNNLQTGYFLPNFYRLGTSEREL